MYIQIKEHCGNEGETWSTFLNREGNERFIAKLKATIEKYPDLQDGDSYLEIGEEEVTEAEVETLIKFSESGYLDQYSKCDKMLNDSLIFNESEDDFVDSYYKRAYFGR